MKKSKKIEGKVGQKPYAIELILRRNKNPEGSIKSNVRSKVEHVFGFVKRLFRFRRTLYRGLQKQQAKFNMISALANLYLADKKNLLA